MHKMGMHFFPKTIALTSTLLFAATGTSGATQRPADETQKTSGAVIAVENHWTEAEVHGDTAYLSQLLLPGYRTVSPSGVVRTKSALLARARKNAQSDKMARSVAAYMKAHPSGIIVTIQGNTAVVTFYSRRLGRDKGITSSDILTYSNGRWHALYSQHTAAKG
jgi:Domain of unknown function (DUF4440)